MSIRPHLRLVKRRHRPVTPQQSEQRELSWLLYITEGYIANLEHALTVNAYTLKPSALGLMRGARRRANETAKALRHGMQGIT